MSLLVPALFASLAFAEEPQDTSSRRLIVCDDTEITADVPRPEVTVFIGRENVSEPAKVIDDEATVERIVAATSKAPF